MEKATKRITADFTVELEYLFSEKSGKALQDFREWLLNLEGNLPDGLLSSAKKTFIQNVEFGKRSKAILNNVRTNYKLYYINNPKTGALLACIAYRFIENGIEYTYSVVNPIDNGERDAKVLAREDLLKEEFAKSHMSKYANLVFKSKKKPITKKIARDIAVSRLTKGGKRLTFADIKMNDGESPRSLYFQAMLEDFVASVPKASARMIEALKGKVL